MNTDRQRTITPIDPEKEYLVFCLLQGRSQTVATFANRPLPGKEDFIINNVSE